MDKATKRLFFPVISGVADGARAAIAAVAHVTHDVESSQHTCDRPLFSTLYDG